VFFVQDTIMPGRMIVAETGRIKDWRCFAIRYFSIDFKTVSKGGSRTALTESALISVRLRF